MERCKFIHKEREKRREECILNHPSAAYKPKAAYLGAGPGEPDSVLTISAIEEERLESTLK